MLLQKTTLGFLIILLWNVNAFAQKKRVLKSKIDTLNMLIQAQDFEIKSMKQHDSLQLNYLKNLNQELSAIKEQMNGNHKDLEKLISDYQLLSKDNEFLNSEIVRLQTNITQQQSIIKKIAGDSIAIADVSSQNFDNPDKANFARFSMAFIANLKKYGENGIKQYVSEEGKFYFLSKPGFIISVSEITSPEQLLDEANWVSSFSKFKSSNYPLIEGERPEIDCELMEQYKKVGCYGSSVGDFKKISTALINLNEFSPENKSDLTDEISKIEKLESKVVTQIFSTDGRLAFYFIKEKDTWKILAIEVEDPCGA